MLKLSICSLAAALVLSCVVPVVASAAKPPAKSPEERFSKMDRNGDKKLSLDEFVGKRTGEQKEKATKRFGKLDKDSDSFLSLEEFKAARRKNA